MLRFAIVVATVSVGLIALPVMLAAQPGPGGQRSGGQRPGMQSSPMEGAGPQRTPGTPGGRGAGQGRADPAVLESDAEALMQRGAYREAEPLLRRIIFLRRDSTGEERVRLGAALNRLSILLRILGRYDEAESLALRLITMREEAVGPDHPSVAFALNSLGDLYRIQGRYAQAEQVLKRGLAIREKVGPEDVQIADSVNALAQLYGAVGRFAEAETLFKRALAIREKKLGTDNVAVAQTLLGMGGLLVHETRYGEADILLRRALALQEKALGPKNPAIAATLSALGTDYRMQGRIHEAEEALKRSLAIREEMLGPEHPDTAVTLANLGFFYLLQYRYASAKPILERSLAIREKMLGPDHRDVAQTLAWLGDVERRMRNLGAAESAYKRSLATYRAAMGDDFPGQSVALRGLAELYAGQGKYADAEPLLRSAVASDEKAFGPKNRALALDLFVLGNFYQLQKRDADAALQFRRSLEISEAVLGAEHRDLIYPLRALALIERRRGQLAEALRLIRRATAIWRKQLTAAQEHETDLVAAAEQLDFRSVFLTHVDLGWAAAGAKLADPRELWGEAFEAAQLAANREVAKSLAGTAARFAAGSDALARAIRQREDAVVAARRVDRALIAAAGQSPSERDFAGEAKLRAAAKSASESLAKVDADLRRSFPQYADLTSPQPLQVAATQKLLRPDEALLTFAFGNDRGWLWVIKANQFEMLPLAVSAPELARAVDALRGRLDPDRNPGLKPFLAGESFALYSKLLQPAESLIAGVRHLLLVPDGALQSLPIGVLIAKRPAREPQTLAEHRELDWFGLQHSVTVLPSVSSLKALRSFTAAPAQRKPFVGIGNPSLGPTGEALRGAKIANLFRGGLADVEKVRELPSLPETAEELRRIAGILGAAEEDLYLGPRASEPLLRKAALDRYRIVEFATHGLLSGEIEGLGEAALVLTPPSKATAENDGLLTASEVASLKLAADWVVLSACNTAVGDVHAIGLTGLAQAFFYAGARSLLVSNWPVASEATVKLTTGAFSALANEPGIGQAEAMRRAMAAMLTADNPPEFAHPMVWAPFVVIGEGGSGK